MHFIFLYYLLLCNFILSTSVIEDWGQHTQKCANFCHHFLMLFLDFDNIVMTNNHFTYISIYLLCYAY